MTECPVVMLGDRPVVVVAATDVVAAAPDVVAAAPDVVFAAEELAVLEAGNAVGKFQSGRVLMFAAIVVLHTSWMS